MARSFEQSVIQESPSDMYELPKFLEKTSSNELPNPNSRGENTIVEETEDELATEKETVSGLPVKTMKKDEGLGESFDQQSELSDSGSSLNSKGIINGGGSGGGVRNMVYESVPEEHLSESGSAVGDNVSPTSGSSDHFKGDSESVEVGDVNLNTNNANQDEITLDPSKLPSECGSAEDLNVFNKKTGSIKKVSFAKNGNVVSEQDKPVTDTYVYDGQARSRFGVGRRRSKNK